MFTKAHLLDIGERALATFLQTFVGIALGSGLAFGDPQVLKSAAIAAGIAAVKGAAAGLVGASDSASLLPARVDPPVDSAA
jgi:hypothetical protein